jgi:hypothetical protein
VTGTVRLNGRAPAGGAQIVLASRDPLAQVPPQVTIPAGDVETSFSISTSVPLNRTTVTIEATYRSDVLQRDLVIETRDFVAIAAVELTPGSILGGKDALGTVRLRTAAPSLGARVDLSASDPTRAAVPQFIDILAGQIAGEFAIGTSTVNRVHDVEITAATPGSQATATLRLRPVVTVQVRPDSVVGGNPVTIEIEIAEPAPASGTFVQLQSTSSNVNLPFSVTIPTQQTIATIEADTSVVTTEETATIRAIVGLTAGEATLTLQPPASITLASLSLNPTTIVGGGSVTATLSLTAPAPLGGIQVFLSNDRPSAILQMPTFIQISSGESLTTFTIRTQPVPFGTETVAITARHGNTKKTATLTVLQD